MKHAVILTGHFLHSRRRASLHWVVDDLQERGWHVTQASVGYSWLSRFLGDRRLAALDTPPRPGTAHPTDTLTTLFHLSPIHPFGTGSTALDTALRPLNTTLPLTWARPLRDPLAKADLVIVESGPPILLAPLVHRAAPRARRIYRVSDDMALLGLPDWLCRLELRHARHFDRISTSSPRLAARFDHPAVTVDPIGIPLNRLRDPGPDPFAPRAVREAVCAGTTGLDLPALDRIARARPRWRVTLLGRLKAPPPDPPPNLVWLGERDFDATLAHIAHADIGLAAYRDAPGIEYQLTNSNRMLLYRHFGLPILAPDRLADGTVPAVIGYGDLEAALARAETAPRRPERLPDWSALTDRLLAQNPVIEPPE